MIDSEQPLKLLSRSLKAPSLPVHSGDREEKSGSIKHPSSFPAVDASALYQLTHVPLSICLPVRLPHVSRFPTISMGMRRMTRLTNGFSKKWENLEAAYALWFAYYNFCRVHKTLRVTPAMEAGITGRPWTVQDLLQA